MNTTNNETTNQQEQIVDEATRLLNMYSENVQNYFQAINDNMPYDALAVGTYAFNVVSGKNGNQDWKSIKEQFDLIQSEVDEVKEAIDLKDDMQVIAECTDVLVTTYGLLQKYSPGVVGEVIQRVIQGNSDKFTRDQQVALDSVNHYAKQGVEVFIQQVGDAFILKDKNNKVRKPVNWNKPDFSDLQEALADDLAARNL